MNIIGYLILVVACLALIFAIGAAFLYLMHKDLPEDERGDSLFSELVSTAKNFGILKFSVLLFGFLVIFSFSLKPFKEFWLYLFIGIVVLGALSLIYIMLGLLMYMMAFSDEHDEDDFFDDGFLGMLEKGVWILTWPKQVCELRKALSLVERDDPW